MPRCLRSAIPFLLATLLPGCDAAPVERAEARAPARSVAVTFDDVPMTGPTGQCDAVFIDDLTTRLLASAARNRMPVAALVTTSRACGDHDLLERTVRRWIDAGAVIGNHSHAHRDLNDMSLAAYIADIERAAALLDPIVAAATAADGVERAPWFRPPLLHAGDTEAKHRGLTDYLERAGYRWAPVTIDNQEWVYAGAYARAVERGDTTLAARIADGYIEHLEENFAFYEVLSRRVLGYEPPQVLLLHANLLNADHLDRVAAMIRQRDYAFVSMPEAMTDSAYARRDPYVGPRGLSWIQRWAIDENVDVPPEPREADWVAALDR